jgi:prevent-host-death family protein
VAEPDGIREVGVRALARATARYIRAAEYGERLVVTRHGDPVAVILSIDESIAFVLAHSDEFARARLEADDRVLP